jgi:hypothetical protein
VFNGTTKRTNSRLCQSIARIKENEVSALEIQKKGGNTPLLFSMTDDSIFTIFLF